MRACEICSNLQAATGALVASRERGLHQVRLLSERGELGTGRTLWLCREHADEVRGFHAETLEAVSRVLREPYPGRRSLIPRRDVTRDVPARRAS